MGLFSGTEDERAFEEELATLVGKTKALIIHNDDFNTFDHVIETLIDVCGHEPLQAEQCTFLIHYSGKCSVRTGSLRLLKPMWATVLERGLTATIEDIPVPK